MPFGKKTTMFSQLDVSHSLPVSCVETWPRLRVNGHAEFSKDLHGAIVAAAVNSEDLIKTGEVELR